MSICECDFLVKRKFEVTVKEGASDQEYLLAVKEVLYQQLDEITLEDIETVREACYE